MPIIKCAVATLPLAVAAAPKQFALAQIAPRFFKSRAAEYADVRKGGKSGKATAKATWFLGPAEMDDKNRRGDNWIAT